MNFCVSQQANLLRHSNQSCYSCELTHSHDESLTVHGSVCSSIEQFVSCLAEALALSQSWIVSDLILIVKKLDDSSAL